MNREHYRIPSRDPNEGIHLCYFKTLNRPAAVVLLSHGFTVDGTESHRMFVEIAASLQHHNIAALLFDYRGTGYSGGAHRDLTPSREIADLRCVHRFLVSEMAPRNAKLGVLGQSHGSYIAILTAPLLERIDAMCVWGASATPLERYRRNFSDLSRHGDDIMLDKGFLLGTHFLDDMARHDALEACARISCPVLFVHAGDDEKVPLAEGRQAFEGVQSAKDFVVIEGGNHLYKRQPELQAKAVKETVAWFTRFLLEV